METVISALDLSGVLLVKDCMETPGGFLLLQALKLAVSRGHKILLLTACHGASHYQQLLRKLGMNMPALMSSGQLVVVDVLHSLSQLPGPPEASTGLDLRSIFSQVLAATQGSTQPVSLVVDDLSALAALADDPTHLAGFLHHCCHPGSLLESGYCFVGLAHWDVEADEHWLSRLEHAAQTVLDLEPLESGQSADVTGRLAVMRQACPGSLLNEELGGRAASSQLFHYKLLDASAAYYLQT